MEPGQNTGIYRVIELAARIVVGLVFLLYGLDKITHPDNFARAIANYRLLPEALVNLVAVTLPWVECVCGLLLLAGQWVRSAALVSAFLLSVFVVAVSITLARGLDIACGCLDADAGRKVGFKLLVEDLLLLGAAAVLVLKAGDRIGWRSLVGVGETKK
jgi:putative oxidoreductase